MKSIRPAYLAFVLTAALGVQTSTAETETVHKTHPLTDSGSVSLRNVNGSITISTWDGAGVKMEARKSANSQEGVDGIQIRVKASNDRLDISTELPRKRGWFGFGNYKAQVDYVLHVPRNCRLDEIESVNGTVSIDGVQGGVGASTVNGRLTVRNVNGSIDLETVNGKIDCATYSASTRNSIRISTVNGAVELGVPTNVDGNLRVDTVNGSIKSALPFTRTEASGRKKLRAVIGDGGMKIDIETVNGSVKLNGLDALEGVSG